jgi:ATP-dependent exoDNAse (exonuclease V) beta subunit
VREQESAGARESEAVAEEEGADAVRLLTIHSAKGLEFKVVVVCDAGRTGAPTQPDEILCLPDGRFGFRVADPATGRRVPVFEYEHVREAERAAAEAETRRLYYVAMTRAIDRLILCGSVDPTRRASVPSPIGWVIERLGTDLAGPGPAEIECGGGTVLVRVDRAVPQPPEAVTDVEQLPLFESVEEAAEAVAFELTPLPAIPMPPAIPGVRRLSYSALALYSRCSYRFFAERLVGLRPDGSSLPDGQTEGLLATEIGDAVHALLETETGAIAAGAGTEQIAAFLALRYPVVGSADAERVAALVSAWQGSPLAARLRGLSGVRHELPFAFEHDGVLLHGRYDVFWREAAAALVVDYKTNRLEEASPAEIVER